MPRYRNVKVLASPEATRELERDVAVLNRARRDLRKLQLLVPACVQIHWGAPVEHLGKEIAEALSELALQALPQDGFFQAPFPDEEVRHDWPRYRSTQA